MYVCMYVYIYIYIYHAPSLEPWQVALAVREPSLAERGASPC